MFHSLDFKVEVEDLRSVAADVREQRLVQHVSEAQARPWALETGPLIRAHVWHVTDDDHVVLVLLHHIISDGWSKNVLVRELATLFQAFAEGKPSGLPDDVLTGFVGPEGQAFGRPVGIAIDRSGAILVADDVGNVVWRVTSQTAARQ